MTDETRSPRPQPRLEVHLDSLEYTREGIKTRRPFDLELGKHHVLDLVRPVRRRPRQSGNRAFPHNSSFPLVGALRAVWVWADERTALIHEAGGRLLSANSVLQVFAHASASGDEHANKLLTDRRAEVGQSLLCGDPELALAVAAAEDWGPREGQSMLRGLGCDPGPIDGVVGKLTRSAIATFRERYARGVFHEHSHASPATPLPQDGDEWTPQVRDALVESMVAVHSPHAGLDRLHPKHPAHGCSEFNAPRSEAPDDARRLTLIQHPQLALYPDAAPCTKGDDVACAVAEDGPQRCFFYREHVLETSVSEVAVLDPRWLWIAEDRYVLSVLIDAPDGDEVVFEVYDGASANTLLARVSTTATMGAASVVWVSKLAWHDDGRPVTDAHPTFVAKHARSSACATAPYPRLGVFRILLGGASEDSATHDGESVRVVASDGSYDQTLSANTDALRLSPRKRMLEFHGAPLDVLSSVRYGFGPQPSLTWISNVLLGDVTASRHGARSIDSPTLEPPTQDDWTGWEHPDRVSASLAKYEQREPIQDW